jgi:hypothetical protein
MLSAARGACAAAVITAVSNWHGGETGKIRRKAGFFEGGRNHDTMIRIKVMVMPILHPYLE